MGNLSNRREYNRKNIFDSPDMNASRPKLSPVRLAIGLIISVVLAFVFDRLWTSLIYRDLFSLPEDPWDLGFLLFSSVLGGFCLGGLMAGFIETGSPDQKIEFGSERSLWLIGLGTLMAYAITNYFI